MTDSKLIIPRPLRAGEAVAIVSPASHVKAEYVYGAAERLRSRGFRVKIMPHAAQEACGSYAATEAERLEDLRSAWLDPEVRVVLCSRGGYGCVHLLEGLSDALLLADPKWLVGFSDVSALHARLQAAGIASVHGSMARYLSEDDGERVLDGLLAITGAEAPHIDYTFAPSPFNACGTATGTLRGGNLAVLSHLMATPYDIFAGSGHILFIEDISEAIYATERMLWQLKLSGALERASGLLVGQFTDSRADSNFPDTATMIYTRLREWGVLGRIPVAFGVPVGHIPANVPLPEGMTARLEVTPDSVKLFNPI